MYFQIPAGFIPYPLVRAPWLRRFHQVRRTGGTRIDKPRGRVSRRPVLCHYACVAYDEGLATRLLDLLEGEPGLAEKKMFGGLAVMLGGNLAVGVFGDDLLVRADPAQQDQLLAEPGARPFEMTRRPMKGWIVVDASMCAEDEDLSRWVSRGVEHARSLPPK
jgi:TfoX/Sxy family transcriptional regulator of competence genes